MKLNLIQPFGDNDSSDQLLNRNLPFLSFFLKPCKSNLAQSHKEFLHNFGFHNIIKYSYLFKNMFRYIKIAVTIIKTMKPIHLFENGKEIQEGDLLVAHIDSVEGHRRVTLTHYANLSDDIQIKELSEK